MSSSGSSSIYFPSLHQIMDRFWANWVETRFASDVLPSLKRLLIGYIVACVVGVGGGLVLGLSRIARRLTEPLVHFFRSIPSAALLPFAILLFGLGDAMKVFIIGFVSLWPILLNTTSGVDDTDEVVVQTTDVYRIKGPRRLFMVVLPAASPHIIAGMRTSLSLAIIVMIISEMVGSTNGIGYFTLQAQRGFAVADMWSGIVLLGLLGYIFNLAFTFTERRILRWYHASRAGAAAT
ncbi:MAG: ABC transporter permease subunit [Streptosporangiales bacterium]|nr:ABC transporter permease subunit [Streptosporangiales bacterium]